MSRRSVLAAGLLGSVAAVGAGCDRGSGTANASATLPAGPDLVVGVCLELTGSGATVGVAQRKALTIEQTKLNDVGVVVGNRTRRIRLVIKDNQSDPRTAVTATEQLIAEADIMAIIGGATAATSMAIAPLADRSKIPILSTAEADGIVQPVTNRRFVFKLGPDSADVADKLATQLKSLQLKRVAVLAETGAHGDAGLAAMNTSMHGIGGAVVSAPRIPIASTNYKKQAQQAVDAHPDAIVIWAVAPTPGRAAQAVHATGYQGVLMFDSGAASEDSLSRVNRGAEEHSYLVSPGIMAGRPIAVTTPAEMDQMDFFDQYTSLYGTFSGLAVYAADALNLVAEAAARAQTSTRLRIRDELEAVPYDGLAGEYIFSTISHGGVAADSLSLFQLKSDWIKIN